MVDDANIKAKRAVRTAGLHGVRAVRAGYRVRRRSGDGATSILVSATTTVTL